MLKGDFERSRGHFRNLREILWRKMASRASGSILGPCFGGSPRGSIGRWRGSKILPKNGFAKYCNLAQNPKDILCSENGFLEHRPERCARVGFPPSGSYQASLGFAHVFYNCFWVFFDSVDRSMDFLSIGQKDAQGSTSPLRVRIKRVWALRICFTTVFGCSLIRLTDVWIY